jgi:hypothetical protein
MMVASLPPRQLARAHAVLGALHGARADGSAMAVGETVEAMSIELRRQAASRGRVLPRCRGVWPWWPQSLTRQDLAPTVSLRWGEMSATRLGCDGVGHPWPEALVHGDMAACRAHCAPAPTSGRRGPGLVVPTAERKTDDNLRRPAAPPLGQTWPAVAVACLDCRAPLGR